MFALFGPKKNNYFYQVELDYQSPRKTTSLKYSENCSFYFYLHAVRYQYNFFSSTPMAKIVFDVSFQNLLFV